jgi:hypothetical protein
MVLDELAYLLETNGYGDLYVNLFPNAKLPNSPDHAIALYEYGGEEGVRTKDRALPIDERPRVEVINRAPPNAYQEGRLRSERIFRLFLQFSGWLEGAHYESIRSPSGPYFLNWDDRNRPRFVCNYAIRKSRSPLT